MESGSAPDGTISNVLGSLGLGIKDVPLRRFLALLDIPPRAHVNLAVVPDFNFITRAEVVTAEPIQW